MTILAFEVPAPTVTLGAITGMTYGILAVGLVLVYRSSRVINFAHGEIGALGAAFLGLLVTRAHVPYWIAFACAILVSALAGALSEIVVVRRLRNAPSLMSLVATLGLAEFILFFSLQINDQVTAGSSFPQPSFLPSFDVGALLVTPAYAGMLFATPLVVIALTLFLRRSRFGFGIRASADDRDTARLAGVPAARMSTLAWSMAGAVAALTAILVLPTRGFTSTEFLGPGLLLRALAAAVIARMVSIPVALVAGLFVGVIEQIFVWNYPNGGHVEAILFGAILLALLVQRRRFGRTDEKATWLSVQAWPQLPDSFMKVWSIRNLGRFAGGVVLIAALALPLMVANATSIILVIIVSFALVGLSVGIVTGLGGQLSLGQFALAGVGATVSYYAVLQTNSLVVGFLAGGVGAAAVSLAIGLPALRIRGLMLAVTTLSFALATSSFFFKQPWMIGGSVNPRELSIGNFFIDTGKKYYFFAIVVLLLCLLLARNVWRGGVGLRLRAQRDNEDVARAFTIRTTTVKLQGFALAGFVAGIGGALYGHVLSTLGPDAFPIGASIDVTAMTVLGGIGILFGPLIGALYIIGIPQFIPLDNAGLAASALGWLVLILYFPGGIAQLVRPLRDSIVNRLARRAGLDPAVERATEQPSAAAPDLAAPPSLLSPRNRGSATQDVLLKVDGLTKRYGGLVAVRDASLEVRAGETVGLIGPNGAGKTTLLEMIGGFLPPDAGAVWFNGRDVSSLNASSRASLGLIRSFQDARLFPSLTVLEVVRLAMEGESPTRFLRSTLGFQRTERLNEDRARELVSLMGLYPWRNAQVQHLSTGTRRIAELTCLVALNPTLLLLDEPSSGIAQRETEALGRLLVRLKDYLNVTLIVIEHDMPLIMGMSDRIVAMDSGRVIAEGTPDAIKNDPAVVASYLGADVRAILRSGVVEPAAVLLEGTT